ncbi:hypothetical protein H8E07_17690 [bacterium]|nr:hypothetical protein [bacterium]
MKGLALSKKDEVRLLSLISRCIIGDERVIDVAKAMGISRSKAQSILAAARDAGIIKQVVNLEPDPMDRLAHLVREEWRDYGVREVIVLPSPPDQRNIDSVEFLSFLRESLARLAARYVEDLELPGGSHLAIGEGRTMAQFARHYSPSPRRLFVRPLSAGGTWRRVSLVRATAVVQGLYANLNYPQWMSVQCPDVAHGMVAELRKRPEIRAIFGDCAERPAATICSLGWVSFQEWGGDSEAGPDPKTSRYVQAIAEHLYYKKHRRALDKNPSAVFATLQNEDYEIAREELDKRKVIGDICLHGIDRNGDSVDGLLDESIITTKPEQFREWREAGTDTIVVAGGRSQHHVLKATLFAGYFRTIICSTAVAIKLLPERKRPPEYRDVPTTMTAEGDTD